MTRRDQVDGRKRLGRDCLTRAQSYRALGLMCSYELKRCALR